MLVEAGLMEKFSPVSERINQVNKYLTRMFKPEQTIPLHINRTMNFKIATEDYRAVRDIAESNEYNFDQSLEKVYKVLKRSQYACINWWTQLQLVSVMAAADRRIQADDTNKQVTENNIQQINASVEFIVRAYDKLIGKLREIWKRRSFLSRLGTKLVEIWKKLKRVLLSIPSMLIDKVQFVQRWLAKDEKNINKASQITSIIVIMASTMSSFGALREILMTMIGTLAGATPLNAKSVPRPIMLLYKMLATRRAQDLVGLPKLMTRPHVHYVLSKPLSGESGNKIMLDQIAAQIKTSPYQRRVARKVFEGLLEKYSNKSYRNLELHNQKDVDQLATQLKRNDFIYKSPFSDRAFVLSGDTEDIVEAFKSELTARLIALRKGVTLDQLNQFNNGKIKTFNTSNPSKAKPVKYKMTDVDKAEMRRLQKLAKSGRLTDEYGEE
jgi:hypothetical protein